MTSIAIVDDEQRLADILGMMLGRVEGYDVDVFYDPTEFVSTLSDTRYDVVVTDLKMPKLSGIDVLRDVKAADQTTAVVVITAHGTVDTAVEAMKLGAYDYIQKPFDNQKVRKTIENAVTLAGLVRENTFLKSEVRTTFGDGVIAESESMKTSLGLAQRVAHSDATVLILGESGTGKEVVAKSIHYHSGRVGGPFVAVNCKALASGVLESELFGHEKGAFTGAQTEREGWFQRASGGTLFLDEIGEIDDAFQGKLLRVLQEREVVRVGGNEPIPIDVRVIAATNRNLAKDVEDDRFREDLYYRLAVIPIELAPLRERVADVVPLAKFFLRKFCDRMHRPTLSLSEDATAYLLQHSWPGNVRELENTIERAVVLTSGETIEVDDLMLQTSRTTADFESLGDFVDAQTATHIRRALEKTGGKKAEAADLLGIERTTLYRLIKRLAID